MHRKLFNMGGVQRCQLQYFGGILQKCTYTHACAHSSMYKRKHMYMLLNVHTPMHAPIHMYACTCRYIKTIIYLHSYMKIKDSALNDLEFQELDVSPGRTEVKQGKFAEYIFPAKGYFRETNKSQNINPISPTPKFTFGIIQIKVKSLSTSFQWLVQYKINLSV